MNILLYLPGMLLLINWTKNYFYTIGTVLFIVCFQLLIATPFLIVNFEGYLSRAFEFSRKFGQRDSAYWQFVPEGVFVSGKFHFLLLFLHIFLLLVFLFRKAAFGKSFKEKLQSLNVPTSVNEWISPKNGKDLEPQSKIYLAVAYTLFSINFIGIVFSRSMHIWFYSWYMHSIPFIICFNGFSFYKLGLFLALEAAYIQFPPSVYSSGVILFIHILFLGILDKSVNKITPQNYKTQDLQNNKKKN